jgi:hypothetical protein
MRIHDTPSHTNADATDIDNIMRLSPYLNEDNEKTIQAESILGPRLYFAETNPQASCFNSFIDLQVSTWV